jgi:hypothetical protein
VEVIFTGIGVLLSVSVFDSFRLWTVDDDSQAAKVNSASQATLAIIFDRIVNFFRRLETYVKLPPISGMTEVIVKIVVEVLSILAIATKEIKQSRASELICCGMNHFC